MSNVISMNIFQKHKYVISASGAVLSFLVSMAHVKIHKNMAKYKISNVMILFTKDISSSLIISQGHKHKLTIAQNEQTRASNETRSRGRP